MDGQQKLRLTVAEAASAMGVSQDAIRKRIQRNTLQWEKDDKGRVYVYLDASETREATDQDGVQDTALEILQDQVDYLRRQLEVWQEEARRKDHIIAALTERIPELEPTSEPRESPTEATESAGEGEPLDGEGRRSWWRRFFGF